MTTTDPQGAVVDGPTIPTWHHPHHVNTDRLSCGVRYTFRPFTGDEPEPAIPADVEAAFSTAIAATQPGTTLGDAVRAARADAWREETAANTMWLVARHNRRMVGLIRQVAPHVAAFQQAERRAVDTYGSLHGTPDGFWQAKLLTLTEQRQAAMEAARRLDRESRALADWTSGVPERVLAETPPFSVWEKDAGVDLGGWYPEDGYSDGDGPDVTGLKRLFAEQDERIAQVARLFPVDGQ